MANTTISAIAARIVQNKGSVINSDIGGRLTADTKPGQYVVLVAGTWVKAASSTAAHKLLEGGIVKYEKEYYKDSSGNLQSPSIDTAYDIDERPRTDKVKIATSGICACFITDQGGTVYPGVKLIVSATAGSLTVQVQADTGATSGTAFRAVEVAKLLRKVVSGDTVAFVGIGVAMSQRSNY